MQERLYEFLRGNKKNYNRKSIYDIWEYSLEELETDHHYIQWLFPLQKRSVHNPMSESIPEVSQERSAHPMLASCWNSRRISIP